MLSWVTLLQMALGKPSEIGPYKIVSIHDPALQSDDFSDIYRAQNTSSSQLPANVRLIAFKKAIVRKLDDDYQLHARLQEIVTEAKQQPIPGLLSIVSAGVDKAYNENDPYVALEWVDGVLLSALFESRQTAPTDEESITVVLALAEQLSKIQQLNLHYVQPAIRLDKVLLQNNNYRAPLLVDPGFSTLPKLLNPPKDYVPYSQVELLGIVLSQLLQREAEDQGKLDSTTNAKRLESLRKQRRDLPDELLAIVATALNIQTTASYQNTDELAAALRTYATPKPLPPITPVKEAPVVEPQEKPIEKPEKKVLGRTRGRKEPKTPVETTEQKPPIIETLPLAQWEILVTDQKEGEQLEPASINEKTLDGKALSLGRARPPQDTIQLERLSENRLYIVSKESSSQIKYLISDSGASGRPMARLNDVPMSIVFPVLLTLNTKIEIEDYQIIVRESQKESQNKSQKKSPRPSTLHFVTTAQRLEIAQQQYEENPGKTIKIPLKIVNEDATDTFWIVVDGGPREWQIQQLPPVALGRKQDALVAPDGSATTRGSGQLESEKEFTLSIVLPPVERSTARTYPLVVRLISQRLTAQVAAEQIDVTVLPEGDAPALLEPSILRSGEEACVLIDNSSNHTQTFKLAMRDKRSALRFEPAAATVTIRPGETGSVFFRPYVRSRNWWGQVRAVDMAVQVTPQVHPYAKTRVAPTLLTGTVESYPLIPRWLLPFVLLALGFLLFLVIMYFRPVFLSKSTTVTPVANTPLTLKWRSLYTCGYSVFHNDTLAAYTSTLSFGNFVPFAQSASQPMPDPELANTFPISSPVEGDKYVVKINGCLPFTNESWSVDIKPAPAATPEPTVVAPRQVSLSAKVENIGDVPMEPNQMLLGQIGDLCFYWDIQGGATKSEIVPLVETFKSVTGGLGEAKSTLCLPIAQTFKQQASYTLTIQSTYADGQVIESPAVNVTIREPKCRLNTDTARAIYDGPGYLFPERGVIQVNDEIIAQSKPFKLLDQVGDEQWFQIKLKDDPRIAWSPFYTFACVGDIRVLPDPNTIPPTPTPSPTFTPTPTETPQPTALPPTATPVIEPKVSIEPEIINLGGCADVKWDIQHVKEVYINDEGVAGVGSWRVCPTKADRIYFTWRIIQLNGDVTQIEKQLIVNP